MEGKQAHAALQMCIQHHCMFACDVTAPNSVYQIQSFKKSLQLTEVEVNGNPGGIAAIAAQWQAGQAPGDLN